MKKGSTSRIWIKLLVILVAVFLIAGIANFILASVIRNKIAQSLRELSPTIQSNYSSIHVNLLASTVSVENLQLYFIPYHSLEKHRHSLYFKQASLTGISFFKLIFDKKLSINRVDLEKAEIRLDQFLIDKRDSAQQSIFAHFDAPFKSATIKNFTLSQATVWLGSDSARKPLLKGDIAIYDQELMLSNKIDSFHMGSFDCFLSDIRYPMHGRYHELHINKLDIDSRKETLHVDSVSIIPLLSKMDLGRRLGHQADWVEASIAEIQMSKLKVEDLLHNKFVADRLVLSECNVHIFRDRKLPREEKIQPMLNDYLNRIAWDVRVNTFKINNATVVSEEMPKDGTKSGYLKIAKINVSMSPVHNHPGKNSALTSDTYVEGSIMNSGTITAHIRAPLKENVYTIKGTIKNLELPKLNPSAENLGKFHVESGVLNDLDFHFVATEEKATGEIVGEYHNLVLEKLKLENGKKEIATVPTFFLKHLIIPKNKDKSLDVAKRTGKIDFRRDPTRVVTFYFLKSLLDGIRDSFDLGFLLPK